MDDLLKTLEAALQVLQPHAPELQRYVGKAADNLTGIISICRDLQNRATGSTVSDAAAAVVNYSQLLYSLEYSLLHLQRTVDRL